MSVLSEGYQARAAEEWRSAWTLTSLSVEYRHLRERHALFVPSKDSAGAKMDPKTRARMRARIVPANVV